MRRPLRLALELAYVAALCAMAMWATWDHARGDSITLDEPPHIYAALEYVQLGTHFTNPEHPPLAKLLAGWSLAPLNPMPPRMQTRAAMPAPDELFALLRENRVELRALLAAARRPFRWLLALLVIVVYVAARAYRGVPAAMLASALIALDPNFIAHAGVVQTDVPAALFMTVTVVLAIVARASLLWWVAVGAALGLALLAKFSAVLLVPFVIVMAVTAPHPAPAEPPSPASGRGQTRRARRVRGCLIAIITATLVVMAGYAYAMRNMPTEDAAMAAARFLSSRGASPSTIETHARLTLAIPQAGMFLSGVRGVQATSGGERSGWNYLHGRLSRRGFPHYFFVAFLLKSTPAFLLLVLALFFAKRSRWTIGLLAPVVLLFAASIPSSFNIGVRHILPVYPLLAILGSAILVERLPRRAFAVAATLLVAICAASLMAVHPHELGYFNIGADRGARWLSDSNLDWGQDIHRLQTLLRERGWERDTTAIVFSSPILAPELARYRPFTLPIRPGRYAVSAYMEQIGPTDVASYAGAEAGAEMQRLIEVLHARGTRVAKAGASITVWELRLPESRVPPHPPARK